MKYNEENKKNEEIECFTKVIGLDKNFYKAYLYRGTIYNDINIAQYDKVIVDLTKAIYKGLDESKEIAAKVTLK